MWVFCQYCKLSKFTYLLKIAFNLLCLINVRVLLNCYQMTEIDGCYSDYVDHIIIIVIMGAHRQRAWSGHVER